MRPSLTGGSLIVGAAGWVAVSIMTSPTCSSEAAVMAGAGWVTGRGVGARSAGLILSVGVGSEGDDPEDAGDAREAATRGADISAALSASRGVGKSFGAGASCWGETSSVAAAIVVCGEEGAGSTMGGSAREVSTGAASRFASVSGLLFVSLACAGEVAGAGEWCSTLPSAMLSAGFSVRSLRSLRSPRPPRRPRRRLPSREAASPWFGAAASIPSPSGMTVVSA